MPNPQNDKEGHIIKTLSSCESIGPEAAEYFQSLLALKQEFDKDSTKTRLVDLFNAFGNLHRFLILDMLRQKDRCVCELEALVDKSQPAVSRHLRILEDLKLIQGWKRGKFTHYSLIRPTFEAMLEDWQNWQSEITNWFGTRLE